MKNVDELIENAYVLVEQIEPRKYLFPEFYVKLVSHLNALLNLRDNETVDVTNHGI